MHIYHIALLNSINQDIELEGQGDLNNFLNERNIDIIDESPCYSTAWGLSNPSVELWINNIK